jgi:para-nitrobenzyl esterase
MATATPTVTPTTDPNCPIGPVDTSVGVLCGTTATIGSTVVHAFLGVHFAESTGGENRWEPPVPKARATERIQAIQFGDICPQIPDNALPLPPQAKCLSLNVACQPAPGRPSYRSRLSTGSFITAPSDSI